ncbi:uncharacterized protein LOC126910816 [Spodoptera frugiperda]|uniref:SFRICE_006344 n=1 Tax=Spodoptera frugiperda TaxID=7108 RepID=A0A2H1WX89_SPOFR|nr:uncharacterized protein LOC126910816 [Spodoptera frugiperda]
MENNGEQPNDKKFINKARSCNTAPPMKLKSEPAKRKSFNVNEAVRSLDLALGRLKKSKLVNGEFASSRGLNPMAQGASDMFMDMCSSSTFRPGTENASLMSMNFSHYELMRNVSRSNCNSDGAFSGTTCSARLSAADVDVKDEHLERYFRSVEMWSRNYRDPPSSMHLDLPDK